MSYKNKYLKYHVNDTRNIYKNKYLKYKNKYLALKNQLGGGSAYVCICISLNQRVVLEMNI